MVRVKCPAAEMQHPVLSPNKDDVECRITGRLRPARVDKGGRGKEPVICCSNYADCTVWKTAKDKSGAPIMVQEANLHQRAKHVMTGEGHEREVVQVGHG